MIEVLSILIVAGVLTAVSILINDLWRERHTIKQKWQLFNLHHYTEILYVELVLICTMAWILWYQWSHHV